MTSDTGDVPAKPSPTGLTKLTKLTVNLVPQAVAAMEESAARDGDSKTDVVNRALKVYNLVGRLAAADKNGVIQMLDPEGNPIRIAIL